MKKEYITKQNMFLLSYLQKKHGRHVTVKEIAAYCEEHEIHVSQATIYRYLEKLVKEGIVAKYVVDANSSACFFYVGEEKKEEINTFHCKCVKCGKLYHIHCDEITQMEGHLQQVHGFAVDPTRTILYGICSTCTKK
jgi:Fur family ferric uptake transcriptional regulator